MAALLVSNALLAVYYALLHAVGPNAFTTALSFANSLSVLPFLLLPFYFPRRRLSKRGERGLLAVVFAFLVLLALTPVGLVPAPFSMKHAADTVLFAALLAGTPLLLDAYLDGPGPVQRDPAKLLLAAYLLKVAVLLLLSPTPQILGIPGTETAFVTLFAVTLLAVPLALLASRVRRKAAGRRWRDDALVLGIAALALLVPRAGIQELEYLLVRPLLFAYGMLRYQLLDVDLRRERGLIATALAAGCLVLFVTFSRALGTRGVDPTVAAGFALLGVAVAGIVVGGPVLRALLGSHDARGRDRTAYRAALEASLLGNPDHAGANAAVLQALRGRLGISEREAALVEAEARANLGRLAPIGGAGEPFLGRYRIGETLGEGGEARTFGAHDEKLGRRVVLKVARGVAKGDRRRLLREARLLARLDHPAIVRVLDVEEVGDEVIVVLEHLEGGSLADRLQRGPLKPPEAFELAHRLLLALETAHAEGIVHGDLKPANVLFGKDGAARLADFGVARANGMPKGEGTVTGFTVATGAAGTLRYMSPEQVRGGEIDGRSDLYSLGAVLYEALAGRPYVDFEGRSWYDSVNAIVEEIPLLPLEGVGAGWNALLAGLLAKDPEGRPATAAEARARLATLGP